MTRTLLGVACVLLLWGCHKKTPSAQFVEAQGLFTTLVDSKGDDAWNDPDMDRVYTLCNAVTAKSLDFEAARKLMARIDEERAKRLQPGGHKPPTSDTAPAPQWPDFPKPPSDAADAGAADEPPIAGLEVGANFALLQAKYGPCFEPTSAPIDLGGGSMADGWLWAGRPDCPKALAAAANKVILVQNGKVLRLADKSAMQVRTFEVSPDGGETQVGGPPPAVADAGPPAPVAPVDAGAP